MKQAYTNTIRGGNRHPLTIPTGSKKQSARAREKQQVPQCAYGKACNRKGCMYRHTEPSANSYDSYHDDPRSKICKPFLAGLCTYGYKCMYRHPDSVEAELVKAKYMKKSCSYGDDCQTEGCLYFHPYQALQNFDQNSKTDLIPAVGELTLSEGWTQNPSYHQWLAMDCPAPQNMDYLQINSIWYHTSGMQRDPFDVYCLMYPRSAAPITHTASSTHHHTSQPDTSLYCQSVSDGHLPWIPSTTNALNLQAIHPDPKSFDEWKKNGCPYPSWFQSDTDPWYDDDGIRRTLQEVYDVLYGENAQSRFEELEAIRYTQQISSDPTPAEVAKGIAYDSAMQKNPQPNNFTKKSTVGWATVASQPANRLANNIVIGKEADQISTVTRKNKVVIMPKECWLPDTANSDYFRLYPDPISRFLAVNECHKAHLATVNIPPSFEGSSSTSSNPYNPSKNSGKVTLLDVHFQSSNSIYSVLNHFLPLALEKHEEVWIITGVGSHVEVGHQRRADVKTGGVLFNAVKNYLLDREIDLSVEWKYGKDAKGAKYPNGSFLVRRKVI